MTILIGFLGLSFLVFFHELGHFLVARACGVTVEAFSVGMGPTVLHKKIGDTDYRLSLIPLGGYCSMLGESDYKKSLEDKSETIDSTPDSFYGVHPFKRLLIAFAGPFFNFIFAVVAFFIVALMGYVYYSAGTTVQMVGEVPEYAGLTSPASDAGMKSGDKIISIDGKLMEDFSDIVSYISLMGDETMVFTVERDGKSISIPVKSELDKETGARRVGIVAMKDSVVARNYGPYPFFPALGEGFSRSFEMLGASVRGIARLFQGVDVTSVLSGPARTTSTLGDSVRDGFSVGFKVGVVNALEMLALISISLFLANILPIPILDGGLILFAFIECVARRRMSPRVLYVIQIVGIVMVGALVVLAIFGDISYFIRRAS